MIGNTPQRRFQFHADRRPYHGLFPRRGGRLQRDWERGADLWHRRLWIGPHLLDPTWPRAGAFCLARDVHGRSEEHTSELQLRENLVCRLLLEKKKKNKDNKAIHKEKKIKRADGQ